MVGSPVRVGIVEDEALMRDMLVERLTAQEGIRVVHAVPGVTEARLVFAPGAVDVALLDVNLPDGNGVALGVQLQRQDPHIAIVLLSSEDVMGLFTTVQEEASRPWSYLSKRSSFTPDVLTHAVVATAAGHVVLDPYLVQRSEPRAGSAIADLTPAQFGVLRLVAEGLSNQAAAERLGINTRSVESHLKSIYQRLGIDGDGSNRRVAAVLSFLEQTGRSWRN
ncbi:MAG: response regulator transcription factor [Cellulomonadaceae bacterium]|jgi:DNA-binding NarL/FixJ family response regulator|nr:response regulator transcription factor [Cellulomonadaceae bacterium]